MQRRLDRLWEIGKTDRGGVTRLAYSEEENDAFEYVLEEISAIDSMAVEEDSIGNVFATTAPEASESLYLGSHLDSVFNGGRLDGTLGVVAALEAIEAVEASDEEPEIPPTLVLFRAEESARFGQAMIGSRGALGLLTTEDFSVVDQSNVPLWRAMQEAGFQPENLSEPTLDLNRIAGFLELHIEQGRVLDETSTNVGVVSSIRAPVRYRFEVLGDYDHSGATPMSMRRDAIAGAAEMITAVEEIGIEFDQDGDIVTTVGDITVSEGAINKVCGELSFPVDVRSNDRQFRDRIEERIVSSLEAIAEDRDLVLNTECINQTDPVELDEDMMEHLLETAESIGTSYRRLPSGGGHDAMNVQRLNIPTGMLFVPSVDGVSHNPAEETSEDAIEDAATVFARSIVDGVP
ncbi:M20 family metallo-hydrolase [Natrarchaeobius halalkaliphilus]|nr:M20 family metallo-hydrolase [Natrarchaeobius halalkaliphilus]